MTISAESVLDNGGAANTSLAVKRLNTQNMKVSEALLTGKTSPIAEGIPPVDNGATAFYNGLPIYCTEGSWKYFSDNSAVV